MCLVSAMASIEDVPLMDTHLYISSHESFLTNCAITTPGDQVALVSSLVENVNNMLECVSMIPKCWLKSADVTVLLT